MSESWKELLRCSVCGTTEVASLCQGMTDDHPTFASVPDAFKVVTDEHGPNFHCAICDVPAVL